MGHKYAVAKRKPEKTQYALSNSKGKIQLKVNLEGYAAENSTNKA